MLIFLLGNRYWSTPKANTPSFDKPAVKAIVIACNTATAYGLDDIRAAVDLWKLPIMVVGVVEAGADSFVQDLPANGPTKRSSSDGHFGYLQQWCLSESHSSRGWTSRQTQSHSMAAGQSWIWQAQSKGTRLFWHRPKRNTRGQLSEIHVHRSMFPWQMCMVLKPKGCSVKWIDRRLGD